MLIVVRTSTYRMEFGCRSLLDNWRGEEVSVVEKNTSKDKTKFESLSWKWREVDFFNYGVAEEVILSPGEVELPAAI